MKIYSVGKNIQLNIPGNTKLAVLRALEIVCFLRKLFIYLFRNVDIISNLISNLKFCFIFRNSRYTHIYAFQYKYVLRSAQLFAVVYFRTFLTYRMKNFLNTVTSTKVSITFCLTVITCFSFNC